MLGAAGNCFGEVRRVFVILVSFFFRAGSQQLSHRDALLKYLEGIKASDAGHCYHERVLNRIV